ncbi:2-isopropylmalate synthase [Patulibacter defluvii]|uniref:2-isopropylmalate synthase n=1 Tax=Patulibacter defluvii TaxID=3095358 RepID=UPI002A760146|nr:2-isopropylmalate synthase [Patulibacter sp. DM4]
MTTPADPNRVIIFDTTLRDGEQSPGISLNKGEKLEIAHQLARLGVDVIEAGFPIASPGDFDAVQAIAREVQGPVIAGLARAQAGDIDRAGQAVKDAERPRIHTFISTSDIHIEHQMRNTRADVLEGAKAAVAHARSLVDDVEFSPMDATRADPEFTAQVLQIAIDEGATTINVPDTVGYATPDEYAQFLTKLYEYTPGLRDVVLSVHCHDDLGLAVANSLAGLAVGARQIECAVNGIGERAGNTSLEEIIMLLATRHDRLGYTTGAVTTEIARTSRLVSRLTGYAVQPNKAIVGRNAFSHESGIHQDGVLKNRQTFEIMDPATVGIDDAEQLVLGKHSGRAALKDALAKLGYDLDGQALRQAFDKFKEVADRKKQVTAMDLEALVTDELRTGDDTVGAFQLISYAVEATSDARPPHAVVVVATPDQGEVSGSFTGDGPVDAVFRAIDAAIGVDARLREYRVDAVTGGQDALAQASVVLELGTAGAAVRWDLPGVVVGDRITGAGQAVDPDTIRASAIAYLRALNVAARKVAAEHRSDADPAAAGAALEPTP